MPAFFRSFSGTGNVGIRSISRRVERAVFVEKDSGSHTGASTKHYIDWNARIRHGFTYI